MSASASHRTATVPGPTPAGASGHTLVELLLVCVLIPLLLAVSYETLTRAYRFYSRQLLLVEAREATRVAVEVLGAELRAISPGAGDLYAIAPDSLALRSFIGLGFVCRSAIDTLSLWRASGVFTPSPTDSVRLFIEGDPATRSDDRIVSARIRSVGPGGVPACPGGNATEKRLVVEPAPVGLRVGSPVRAFRPHVYRLYRGADGLWWLGQRLRGGVIQPITGPFASPARSGLELRYLDAAGAPAGTAHQVAGVGIKVRSRIRRGPRGPTVGDSLDLLVAVRNR